MNRLEELEAFVAVVDYKGFGNAGGKFGIAKSMVSRRVSELERRLAVQLLQRTTRRQSLTDAGREFYRACDPATMRSAGCRAVGGARDRLPFRANSTGAAVGFRC